MHAGLVVLLLTGRPVAAEQAPIILRARSVVTEGPVSLDEVEPWSERAHLLARLDRPYGGLLTEAHAVSALGADGFVISVDSGALPAARAGALPRGVAWLGAIEPRDRTHPSLHPALATPMDPTELQLQPFRDVDRTAFARALRSLAPDARCDAAGLCRLEADHALIRQLASWDPVAWVQPWGGPPVSTLSGVTQALGVDEVRPPSGDPPSYELGGAGVIAALFDPDCVDATHPDLAGRVLRSTEGDECSHATQCGGVLGGSGAGTQQVYPDWDAYRWTGVAPEVEIAFYETTLTRLFTLGDQIVDAVESYDAQLGSFSFRQGIGGDYESEASSLDALIHNGDGELSRAIPFFWATANEAASDGYGSLADYTAAKNLMAVGATNANDDSLADFSSMGPTADGRLKPDVMAPGCYDTMNVEVEVDRVRVLGDGEAAFDWSFETDDDSEGWAPMHDLEAFEVSDGLLHTTVTGRDPYMHGPELSWDSADLDSVELSFHAGTVTSGQIFWVNSEGGWAEERHIDFFMPGTGEPRTVELDVAAHDSWTGTFEQLRLDPAVLGVTVPEEGPTYVANCGTSLAAPAVAGVAALMIDAWQQADADRDLPAPAVYKAVLAATATDLVGEGSGTNPDLGTPTPAWQGPDYGTGWGLVWAPGAVAAFAEHSDTDPRFHTGELTVQRDWVGYYLEVPEGTEELRAMLAWDDPAGEPMAQVALQNDLDLRLVDPNGNIHEPWILDPDDPSAAATTGINTRDNLEGVSVYGAPAGTWLMQLSVNRLVNRAQDYVVLAAADGEVLPLPPDAVQDTGLDSSVPGDSDEGGGESPGRCGCAASGAGGAVFGLLGLWGWVSRRRMRVTQRPSGSANGH